MAAAGAWMVMACVVSNIGCGTRSSPGSDRCTSSSVAPQRFPRRRSRYPADAPASSPTYNLFLIERVPPSALFVWNSLSISLWRNLRQRLSLALIECRGCLLADPAEPALDQV